MTSEGLAAIHVPPKQRTLDADSEEPLHKSNNLASLSLQGAPPVTQDFLLVCPCFTLNVNDGQRPQTFEGHFHLGSRTANQTKA